MGQNNSRNGSRNEAGTSLLESNTEMTGGPAPPVSDAFKYWRSVKKGSKIQMLETFDQRGALDIQGAAYFEPGDIEKFAETATLVGVSYQISAIMAINSVEETFKVVCDLNMRYKIKDDEKDTYISYQRKGCGIEFQGMQDDPKVLTKPPIWEIRNAVFEPEFHRMRVAGVLQYWDHRTSQWAWYALLFCQFRCVCTEEFEMHRFPFTRNSLQVQLQVKQPFESHVLVPYNCRSAMPHWVVTKQGGDRRVIRNPPRGNTFKTDRSISNWQVETHHAAFIPVHSCPPMPSTRRYGMCVITVQCKQEAAFYLWNTVPVVFFLPVLAVAAIQESYCNLADRLSIVLTLLLTMATYKVSISAWIPQKDYLTFMDRYIILGFLLILLIGFIVGAISVIVQFSDAEDACQEDRLRAMQTSQDNWWLGLELQTTWVLSVGWILAHVIFGVIFSIDCVFSDGKFFYTPWPKIMAEENKGLLEIAEDVKLELKMLGDIKFQTGEKPSPPVDAVVQDKVGALPPQFERHLSMPGAGLPGKGPGSTPSIVSRERAVPVPVRKR